MRCASKIKPVEYNKQVQWVFHTGFILVLKTLKARFRLESKLCEELQQSAKSLETWARVCGYDEP